jgi:hypothetical protein
MAGQGFELRADFFRGALTGAIVGQGDDLDPDQPQLLEPETGHQRCGARRDAFSLPRLAHPVTQIGAVMHRIALIEPDAAEQFAAAIVEHRKGKIFRVRPALFAIRHPRACILHRVTGGAPGQPAAHRGQRVLRGVTQSLGIARLPGTQA